MEKLKRLLGKISPVYEENRKFEKKMKKLEKFKNVDRDNFEQALQEAFYKKTGRHFDLANPRRFTEKVQWRKLKDNNPIYSVLSDKYAVREWVARKIGEEYLIPSYGCWDHAEEIDFSKLPDTFVLKTNNGSKTNLIVKNKADLNLKVVRTRLNNWLKVPYEFVNGFEMHYARIKPLIICEKYLSPDDGDTDLKDYKFYCFHGVPTYCQVLSGRSIGLCVDFYDRDWNHMPFKGVHAASLKFTPNGVEKPATFEEMLKVAAKLSEGFAYVRVDLYENNGKIYFGEMTFTPSSGMGNFEPDEWDYTLGDMWDLTVEQADNDIIQCSFDSLQ